MSLVVDFVDLLFSFYFYVFIWILLLILTFLLIRKLLQDYKYQKILKNSIGLIESENKEVILSENRFYLDQACQFLDKLFKKGQNEIKDQSLENSPLFQRIFDLINTRTIRKEFVLLLANEMRKIRDSNEFLTDSLGSELNFFLDHPEDWTDRFLGISSNKKEQEVQIYRVKATLLDYLTKFIEIMKIPELNTYLPRN